MKKNNEENASIKKSSVHISCFKNNCNMIYTLPANCAVPINIPIAENNKDGYSYLKNVEGPPGVNIGNAIENNEKGKCYVLAINNCEYETQVEIKPQELLPFEFEDSEYFTNTSAEERDNIPEDRSEIIFQKLCKNHHSQKEKEILRNLIDKSNDLFYLDGDPHPRT
ncbi:hypothetical protein TKK_0016491 [Trichogramma kaykai]|uniref:Uncharacterized protein n=1 Tax=Trichogramma kaykai TaxID=54128 RepID=A0ABD2W6U6_9HYME